MESLNLFNYPIKDLLRQIKADYPEAYYQYDRHRIQIEEGGKELGFLRLPLHYKIGDQLQLNEASPTILYLTIESGSAALILRNGLENTYHTTFSAYMTRKKQGVSQIKYLNKKGKSRAGSRVRLAKTIEFFENINTTLQDLFDDHHIDRIALNCNKTLIPYLFGSNIQPPFDKKDERIYKIPVHIPQSNFTNLEKVIKKLMAPMLFYDEKETVFDFLA